MKTIAALTQLTDMPKSCKDCPYKVIQNNQQILYFCPFLKFNISGTELEKGRYAMCPLRELYL